MTSKWITIIITSVVSLSGAMLVYAQVAYFPMERGAVLEQKVEQIQQSVDYKLDLIIKQTKKEK